MIIKYQYKSNGSREPFRHPKFMVESSSFLIKTQHFKMNLEKTKEMEVGITDDLLEKNVISSV